MESNSFPPLPTTLHQDLKTQFQQVLINIQRDSDILVANLSRCLSLQSASSLSFDLQTEKACDHLTNLATQIFKAPVPLVNQIFRELDLVRAFEFLLAKVFKEVLKISDDQAKNFGTAKGQDQNQSRLQTVIYSSISFIAIFGHLLDYLLFDNHRFDIIIEMFSTQKALLKLILSLMLEANKIQTLQKIITHQKKNEDHRIILNYARIMFNLIISPNNVFKVHFIEEQGIYILKKILKRSYQEMELEIYFYCLGMIPPLLTMHPQHKQEFLDNGFGQMLLDQLQRFYAEAQFLHVCSPLILALRALLSGCEELRREFVEQEQNLEIVFEMVHSSYGNAKLKNIFLSSIILLCEVGIEEFEKTVIPKRVQQIKEDIKEDEPGAQIRIKEQVDRLQGKIEKLKSYQRDYIKHQEIMKEVRSNIFDDSELERSLSRLNQIWQQSSITRSFFVTTYGNMDLIMSCIKNLDEGVMLKACQCVQTILQKEDGAQDLFLRHKGIITLKNCLLDYQLDIKKCSLTIMSLLVQNRDDAKHELLDTGVIDLCINLIDKYPEDDVDHEIMCLALITISQVVPSQPKIQAAIVQKGGLSKIVMQLKLLLDQIQKKPEAKVQVQTQVLEKLSIAIINIIYSNEKTQDLIRTELQLFNPMVQFLTKALEGFEQRQVYSEDNVCSIVNLIINAIDTNKANQDYFLKNFKIEPLIKQLLNLSLRICGMTSLLISHLTWTSIDGQALFSSREILKRLVSLMDFNQLINESEADISIDSLMEVAFYSLLALINLSHGNMICQQLVKKLGGLQIIVKLLKSPSFEPKKTACLCLVNFIQNNQENVSELLNIDAVSTLVNLINDEEDDDLSNKAYQCLEYMGPVAVIELIKQMKAIMEKRELRWKYRSTIMIDVFMNRERHIWCKTITTPSDDIPNVREFGPQDKEDLIDLKSYEKLERILPVLNGLVYMKPENRQVVVNDIQLLNQIFNIFKNQLPIEVHENALFALTNIVMEAKKQVKEQIVKDRMMSSLIDFVNDLQTLELDVLKSPGKFVVTDYGVKMNYEAEQHQDEKTIEQIQATTMDMRVYEYHNSTDEMFFIDQSNQKVPVAGRAFQGQGLKKEEVIKHLQSLRSLAYSVFHFVIIGNAKLGLALIEDAKVMSVLSKDVQSLVDLIGKDEEEISENLWDESLEMLLDLITTKEIFKEFETKVGLNVQLLEKIKQSNQHWSWMPQQKKNAILAKLTHIVNEQLQE